MREVSERAVAVALLILFSPLFAVCSLLIFVSDRRPVVFRQTRVGKDMEMFKMYKFRTMVPGAERQHESLLDEQLHGGGSFLLHKKTDQRVTRIGKFLRKSSLDELPQLINVIKGDMSFVGPRPMLPEELPHLWEAAMARFTVKPGITGLAQVNGRSALTSREYVGYDIELVKNPSVLVYWKIVCRTPVAVFSGRGAV